MGDAAAVWGGGDGGRLPVDVMARGSVDSCWDPDY